MSVWSTERFITECQAQEGASAQENPNSHIDKIWGEGCQCVTILIVWTMSGCLGNLNLLVPTCLRYTYLWSHACAHHHLPGQGVLGSVEELRDMYQIIICISSGGTMSPVTLLSY